MEIEAIQELKKDLTEKIQGHMAAFTMLTKIKIDSVEIEKIHPLKGGRNDYVVDVRLKI